MNPELISLFEATSRQSTSDIHLVPGELPHFRKDGELVPATDIPPISQQALLSVFPTVTRTALENGNLLFAEAVLPFDDFHFVVYAYRSGGQFAASIRVMLGTAPTLDKVGGDYQAQFAQFARMKQGLLLVTGPLASGKHTTAFALLQEINQKQSRRIHLLEDAPSYWLRSNRSLVSSLVIGQDVPDYEAALRLLIRGADPDVIFIADLPNTEVVQQALSLTQMGHLVVASATAPSASDALATICQALPADALPILAEQLIAVTNQRLLRRAQGPGRIPAYEVLRGDTVREFIQAEADRFLFQAAWAAARNDSPPLSESVQQMATSGKIHKEDATTALADYPTALYQ